MTSPARKKKRVVGNTKYPRVWQHKKTKKKMRVMPWWETVQDGEIAEVDELGQMVTVVADRPCKFGMIYQIGFLLENEHGVWFGVGPGAAKEFKDLGFSQKERQR